MKHPLIMAAFLAAAAAPSWAINKCTGSDGRTSYQEAPCATGRSEVVNVKPASGHAAPVAASDGESASGNIKLDNEIAAAIRQRRPLAGMTMAQLRQAMGGEPSKVNVISRIGGVPNEQWIYRRPGETWTVYSRDGVVEAVQGGRVAAPRQEARHCPSPYQVRDWETSASSITLTPSQRSELTHRIREAKNCHAGR